MISNERKIGLNELYGSIHSAFLGKCIPNMFANEDIIEDVLFLSFIKVELYNNNKGMVGDNNHKLLIVTNKKIYIKSCIVQCTKCDNSFYCPQIPNYTDL